MLRLVPAIAHFRAEKVGRGVHLGTYPSDMWAFLYHKKSLAGQYLYILLLLLPTHALPYAHTGTVKLTLNLLGATLLWIGWFGFNGGSALAANSVAAVALINTQVRGWDC